MRRFKQFLNAIFIIVGCCSHRRRNTHTQLDQRPPLRFALQVGISQRINTATILLLVKTFTFA